QKDGTLSFDAARFQAKADADPAAVQRLIGGTTSQDGVVDLLSSVTDTYTRTVGGSIAVRQDALNRTMRDLQSQMDATQRRLDTMEATLRQRFANLEQVVSQLQSSGSSLLNALSQLETR